MSSLGPWRALFLAAFSAPWDKGHGDPSLVGWLADAGPMHERRCRKGGERRRCRVRMCWSKGEEGGPWALGMYTKPHRDPRGRACCSACWPHPVSAHVWGTRGSWTWRVCRVSVHPQLRTPSKLWASRWPRSPSQPAVRVTRCGNRLLCQAVHWSKPTLGPSCWGNIPCPSCFCCSCS